MWLLLLLLMFDHTLLYILLCLSLCCPQMHNLPFNIFLVYFFLTIFPLPAFLSLRVTLVVFSFPLPTLPSWLMPSLPCPLLFTTASFATPSLNRWFFASPLVFSCVLLRICALFQIQTLFALNHIFPCYLSLSVAAYVVSVQCPWGSSPHPCSRCSMPLAGQAWVPWASPSGCWPTTLKWRSQRWMSITMRWTLSLTSAHDESTGNRFQSQYFSAFFFDVSH